MTALLVARRISFTAAGQVCSTILFAYANDGEHSSFTERLSAMSTAVSLWSLPSCLALTACLRIISPIRTYLVLVQFQ